MTLHHTKHHQTYITNLNAALKSQAAAAASNDIVTQLDLQIAIRFNAGGDINHRNQPHLSSRLRWKNVGAVSPRSKPSS